MTNNKYLRLSAVNENDYYLYSGSPREICKTVISQGKFVANLKKQACPERSRMKPKPNKANCIVQSSACCGLCLDCRFRGNDKCGIPGRRKILIQFVKTKPIY